MPKTSKFTATELAKIIGVTHGRVSQMVKDKILTDPLDLYKSVKEYLTYKESLHTATDDEDRIKKAKADLLEIEVQRKNVELAPVTLMQTEIDNAFNVIRKTLDAQPNAYTPKLLNIPTQPEVKAILQDLIDTVLKEIANPDIYTAASKQIEADNKRRAKHTSK